jgi:DNA-binding HxlR family transcriptional regulator
MVRMKRSSCPVAFALDIIGDKWSLLVLRDLIFKDKKYYNDFLDAGEGISTNILAERLERLKSEGLIKGTLNLENKRRTKYTPTEKALDLIPMILEMIEWSAKYDSKTGAPKEFLKQIKKDRRQLARQVRSKFEG